MPKSQKKKKSVKKKAAPQRKKSVMSKKADTEPILETAEEKIPAEITPGIKESEFEIEDLADVSEERASIISIVKGLEGQVETAFKLKEVLEDELDAAQQRLSEEKEARSQLEVQVNSLQARVALAEQLREDISFVEEERNKFADELAQTRQELEQTFAERDSLTERFSYSETNIRELENDKMALEAQVMNLKDKIADADNLRKELAETNQSHRQSREQVHDLTRRIEAAETSKYSLETQLTGTHQNAQNLRTEAEQLRRKVSDGENQIIDLRIQLEDQQAVNRDLIEANARLENEIKMANINYEAARNELDAFKNALRDIRSEATRTSGRVRQRYLKPGNSSQKTKNNSYRSRPQPVSTKL
ncbi:MAG: hypothetical protein ACYSSI_07120 [Planctomycetota bacterium]|jgi:chromosome segregation ATPase